MRERAGYRDFLCPIPLVKQRRERERNPLHHSPGERKKERERESVAILAQVICPCLLLRGWVVPAGLEFAEGTLWAWGVDVSGAGGWLEATRRNMSGSQVPKGSRRPLLKPALFGGGPVVERGNMLRDGGTPSEVAEGPAPSRGPSRKDADRPLRWEEHKSEGMNVILAGTPRRPSTPDEERGGLPPKGNQPAQGGTRQKAPLLVHGVRTCPRCLVGPGKEKGGKHYGHDREAENCVLQGTSLRGGAARKQLQQKAAESSTRTPPDQTILMRFRIRGTTTKAKAKKPRMESSPRARRTRRTRTPPRAPKTSRPATRTARPTARDTPTTTRRTCTSTRTRGTGAPSRASKASRQTRTNRPTAGDSPTTTKRTRTFANTLAKATPRSETREQSRLLRSTKPLDMSTTSRRRTRPRSSSSSSTSSTSPRTRPRSTASSSTIPGTQPPRQTCDGHATKGERDPETDEALNAILNWEPAPPEPQPPKRPMERTGTPLQRPERSTGTFRGQDPVQAGAARASGLFTAAKDTRPTKGAPVPGYTKVAEPNEPPRRRNLAQQVMRVATQMDETAQKEGTKKTATRATERKYSGR